MGQTMTHCPQLAQLEEPSGRSAAGPIVVLKPRWLTPRTPTPWISLQTVTQRRQRMHLEVSRKIDGAGGVDEVLRLLPLEAAVGDLDLLAELLELAVLVPVAGEAVARVVGEHQLVEDLARLLHARGVRLHDHPLADRDRAGGLEAPHPLDLDDADAAGADLVDALEVAEVGDLDAVVLGGLEDRPVALGPHGPAVDDEVNGVRHGLLPTAGRSAGSAWPRRWRSACGSPRRPPGSPSCGSRGRGSASGIVRARRRRSRRRGAESGSPRPC